MNIQPHHDKTASYDVKIGNLFFVVAQVLNRFTLAVFLFAFASITSLAQVQPPSVTPKTSQTPAPQTPQPPSLEKQFFKNVLRDQKAIWTSPFKLRGDDAKWLAPLGAGFAGLLATDRSTSAFVSRNGSLPAVSRKVSLGGSAYTTGGVAAGFYLVGKLTNDRKARETGLLAAEALIDAGIVTETLKFATGRERPNYDNGRGRFFTGGNSFPSGHATSAWSVATVIAYEYQNHPLVRYGAFAAATLVSLSRYSGRNHFLSDVLIGSAVGFGVGRFVYRKRHIQIADSNDAAPTKTSKLMPTIIPLYSPRTRTYGGTVAWSF